MNPQDNQESEAPRPAFKDAPEGPSLLDRIVSESRTERRDELILKREELNYKQRLAKMFANANCFADVDKDDKGNYFEESVSIARAMIKIELGESMGFTAAESMTGIDIIKGRPAIGASLRAARMKKAGYSWTQMVCNDKGCWIPLEYQGEPMMHRKTDADGKMTDEKVQVVVSFTEADAQRAGRMKNDNYQKDPSSMFFARAITRAQRRYGPEVLSADILDTYEAREVAETVSGMAAATNAKTAELAGKLATERAKATEKPAPAAPTPAAPTPAAPPAADLEWQTRVLTFKPRLGEPEFLATLHAATGSEDVASVTADNYKAVWAAMEKAVKKAESAGASEPTTSGAPKTMPKSGDMF